MSPPLTASSVTTPSTTLSHVMSNTHVISNSPESNVVTPTTVLSSLMTTTHTIISGILPNSILVQSQHQDPSSTIDPATRSDPEVTKQPRYRPAYELQDGSLERSGRGLAQP